MHVPKVKQRFRAVKIQLYYKSNFSSYVFSNISLRQSVSLASVA